MSLNQSSIVNQNSFAELNDPQEDEFVKLDQRLKMKSVLKIKTEISKEELQSIIKINTDNKNSNHLKYVSEIGMNTQLKFIEQ